MARRTSPLGKKSDPGSRKKGGGGGAEISPLAGLKMKPGQINYGSMDSLGRPTGIRAIITAAMIGTGTKANSRIEPPGWQGGDHNQARGHLLGKQLGGSGDERKNLVTLTHRGCNTPYMRDFENAVRDAVEGGQNVDYRVTPIYEGNNPVPVGVTMEARGDGNPPFHLSTSVPNWEMADRR